MIAAVIDRAECCKNSTDDEW